MEIMKLVGVLVFAIVFAIQIIACLYHKEKLRTISKFFIMPALLLLAICYKCHNVYLYIGIACGFLGDALLIKKNKWLFILGVIFFGLNHISYMLVMTDIFQNAIKWYFYLAAGGVYLAIAIPCIFIFRKYISKEFGVVGAFYIPLILIELGFAIITSNITISMCSLPIVGAILFLISDSYLSYSIFITAHEKDDFVIMLTYGLAQYCFVFGFVLFL